MRIRPKPCNPISSNEYSTKSLDAYNATIQGIPPGDLRVSVEDISQLQRHYTKDRVMLPVALITHGYGNNGRSPVAYKTLSSSIEDRLAANGFCACTVYLLQCQYVGLAKRSYSVTYKLVVEQNSAVTGREVRALFIRLLAIGLCGLKFTTFA